MIIKCTFQLYLGTCDIDFLDLLEKEEADFAEQIRRQKSFLQSVFKDKEELAQVRVWLVAVVSVVEQIVLKLRVSVLKLLFLGGHLNFHRAETTKMSHFKSNKQF